MKININKNLFIFIPILIIMIISFLNLQNAKQISNLYQHYLLKQIIWFIIGFILLFIITKLNLKYILNYSFTFYIIGLILLVIVLFIGKSINNTKAWLSIGFINIQPSEFMKIPLCLYLSNIASNCKRKKVTNELLFIIKIFIVTLIPSILVFLEPDTGAIIFYFIIAFTILYFSNIRKYWFIIFGILLCIFIILFYYLFINQQDFLIKILGTNIIYRIDRIIFWFQHNSYQLENALITIGSSSLLGVGLNNKTLYIPESPTDFIFSYNIGNFGYLSGFLIIFNYILLDILLLNLLKKKRRKKIKLFIISFISMFIFQQIININMNLGLLPIIGIPLPFFSYGGSSIITHFIFLGLILNFYKNDYRYGT